MTMTIQAVILHTLPWLYCYSKFKDIPKESNSQETQNILVLIHRGACNMSSTTVLTASVAMTLVNVYVYVTSYVNCHAYHMSE